ncbi:transcription elongation factor A N-terminal and central domain-containing protein 2 [Tachyglossus aculeatus]|uniref:transcription elongation factor A N-terminal and central domain-containing protein 2 n=1 Tax=Tachyglossus aculeatus TaxID=9261 RepID=UPI0018F52637|nr:transcription elongation factor A N-terminal and central domain-containing protein 2 [Tachyglossus aculeatus]XP_038609220.1 transcription elongation factor A N-terminal and central domain-containing protein 2 [Tachyglossus aculeatus]XP_038609221.1 transcription elongation factor A N-terminal and central domain-containing protein 2 [Tachyglossus aculeatus]XP_038609222.1 transcription elongation factor A N-terminal and central domain-containing protein 2 [Tachyglossus aculeatus]
MDKFVIRKPRAQESPQKRAPEEKVYKQATLESLKRVVVVEDVKRWKSALELPGQSEEVLMEALRELRKKIPSKEVLQSTQIGDAVSAMRGHTDPAVASLAREVLAAWEAFLTHHANKACIEVRSDPRTEGLRQKAREMLSQALELEEADPLAGCIKREAFHLCSRLVGGPYRRTVRALVFALKHRPQLRAQLRSGSLTVGALVRNHLK